MRITKEEMSEMTREKENSIRTADRLVMDELLEMGFSYKHIGTHYLHDSIVCSLYVDVYKYGGVYPFCTRIRDKICKKYKVKGSLYTTNIERTIANAFLNGNIDYIMEIFKNSCTKDKMIVGKNSFIMTMRRKIMESLKEQDSYNATQLRIIIQGEVEKITNISVLDGLCKIVLSLGDNGDIRERI